jgi:hypothetical protein
MVFCSSAIDNLENQDSIGKGNGVTDGFPSKFIGKKALCSKLKILGLI